jgi:hypothetical protein
MTKLMRNSRRPVPNGATDIGALRPADNSFSICSLRWIVIQILFFWSGTWENILVNIGNVAVLTNGLFKTDT